MYLESESVLAENETWDQRARRSIGQGYLTNSKRPTSHIGGVYPTHIDSGCGAILKVGKKEYIDYICGLGTNLLGYNNSRVITAVSDALQIGASHSFPTTLEVKAAEAIKSVVHFVERVKFFKSGSDACTAAVKMARTRLGGQPKVLTNGYHGWHNDFMTCEPPGLGTVEAPTTKVAFDALPDAILSEPPSVVIIEPVMLDMSENVRATLQAIRFACTDAGSILIFDEVITGFRVPKYTVSQYWNVQPDLVILGKATAGGLPLAIVGGPSAILDGDYFISGTYFGDTLALSAMRQIIKCLHTPDYDLNTLWKRGGWFLERFNGDAKRIGADVRIDGYNTRGSFAGEDRHLFFQEACKAGVLFGPSWFYNFPLMQYDDIVLNISASIFQRIKSGEAKFHGEKPVSPFATKVRENGKT